MKELLNQVRELCYAIEELPASEQQTKISIMAAAIGRKMQSGVNIVCLCGSTRFMEAFQAANLRETLAGNIVLSVGCNTKSDADLQLAGELTDEMKARLDELHKRKIDLVDEIFVLNVDGYIGDSTRSEIEYAKANFKVIRYLEVSEDPRYRA